jgi:hypothetical protein
MCVPIRLHIPQFVTKIINVLNVNIVFFGKIVLIFFKQYKTGTYKRQHTNAHKHQRHHTWPDPPAPTPIHLQHPHHSLPHGLKLYHFVSLSPMHFQYLNNKVFNLSIVLAMEDWLISSCVHFFKMIDEKSIVQLVS